MDAEVALQLQVRPLIKRVAQRVGNSSRPGQEFLVRRGISGDVLLRDAVRPHGAPFVVVTLKPDFEEIRKLAIFSDVAGKKMTVVVEDRLGSGELMIETARHVVREKEIFGEEASHERDFR